MTDTNKNKFYRFEAELFCGLINMKFNTTEDAQDYVNFVWFMEKHNKFSPTVIIDNKKKVKSSGNRFKLKIAPTMLKCDVILHEIAHAMMFDDTGDYYKDTEPHGYDFIKLCCELYIKYLKIDRNKINETLKRNKIKLEV